jgi:drug/metabolite transporter (DMT)-like permease
MTPETRAKLLLVFVMVVWGGSFIASKVGLKQLYPVELATIRFAIAVPLLLVITLALEGLGAFRIAKKDLPVLIAMALTGVTLQYIVQFYGMTLTSVTDTALLINMGTFFVIVPSAIFLRERLSLDNWVGVIIAFMGAVVVATGGSFIFSMNIVGDGLVLICAVMWAIYMLIGNKLAGKYSVLSQLNYIFIIGFIGLIPVYLLSPRHAIGDFSITSWACILYLAVVCSVFAYFIFNDAIIKLGPSKAAIYQYLEPLFAIFYAIVLLGEPLTMFVVLGALFIMAGIAMADNNLKVFGYILKEPATANEEAHKAR